MWTERGETLDDRNSTALARAACEGQFPRGCAHSGATSEGQHKLTVLARIGVLCSPCVRPMVRSTGAAGTRQAPNPPTP